MRLVVHRHSFCHGTSWEDMGGLAWPDPTQGGSPFGAEAFLKIPLASASLWEIGESKGFAGVGSGGTMQELDTGLQTYINGM